jgi:hypothetical protein
MIWKETIWIIISVLLKKRLMTETDGTMWLNVTMSRKNNDSQQKDNNHTPQIKREIVVVIVVL